MKHWRFVFTRISAVFELGGAILDQKLVSGPYEFLIGLNTICWKLIYSKWTGRHNKYMYFYIQI